MKFFNKRLSSLIVFTVLASLLNVTNSFAGPTAVDVTVPAASATVVVGSATSVEVKAYASAQFAQGTDATIRVNTLTFTAANQGNTSKTVFDVDFTGTKIAATGASALVNNTANNGYLLTEVAAVSGTSTKADLVITGGSGTPAGFPTTAGTAITLANFVFTPDKTGTYVFDLTTTGGAGSSAAEITITAIGLSETVTSATSSTVQAGVTATLTDITLSGALAADERLEISSLTGPIGGALTLATLGGQNGTNVVMTVGDAATVYTNDTANATTTGAVTGSLSLPGTYTIDWAGAGSTTVIVTPSTAGTSSLTATQTSASGISSEQNVVTVTRNASGANTDGQILGAFTVSADDDGTAPLTDVYGKEAGALNAVTTGGTAATPTFTVARTNLDAGSYTMRFWVDANSNGLYESSEVSTTISFTVAGAVSTISVSIDKATRANIAGHKTFTVTATLADALGGGSAATNVYISESTSAGADSANTYTDIADDTPLARVGTSNVWVGTFNVDSETATATDDTTLTYLTVHTDTDIDATGAKEGTATLTIVKFASLDTTNAIEANNAVGIGDYSAAGVRDARFAAAGGTATITVDPAVTEITYTGTALGGNSASDNAGRYVYVSHAPVAGTTCTTSSGTYALVLADLSFAYTVKPATACVDSESYTVTFDGATDSSLTIVYADPAPTWTTSPANSYKNVYGSTNTIKARLTDQYNRILSSKAVTAVVTGRNPQTVALTTDAAGYVSWSATDASTSTLVLTDSVVFNYPYTNSLGKAATKSSTAIVITYAATAVAVGSVTVTDDEVDNSVAIDQAEATVGVPADYVVYTATVKTAAGASVGSGVLVTFTGGADDLFYGGNSGVTDAAGKASVNVYRHKTGFTSITATANGVASLVSGDVDWVNTDLHARYVTVSAAQSIVAGSVATVTATVTDRWGNPIETGVEVTFYLSGNGRLVTGDNGGAKITNSVGQAQIQVTSNETETGTMTIVAAVTDADTGTGGAQAGQTRDLAGYVGSDLVSGVTAGDRDGKSTTVAFTKSTAVSTADALLELAKAIGTGKEVEAAADAAAEAIDAANAATDAANLAAEAADAATVAAEEARDAADAATAAVEELATQVATLMSALKAQLTTLANTVAKIAKKVKA